MKRARHARTPRTGLLASLRRGAGRTGYWGRGFRALAVVVIAALGMSLAPTSAAFADDDPTSVLGLTKGIAASTVLPLEPGGTVNYRLELVCSNLEPTGCRDAAISDTVPEPLVLNVPSISVSGATYTDSSSGNTVSLAFTQSIFGGQGLDDGTSVVITYSATLPANVSGDWDGVELVNQAVFTASNAVNSGLSRTAVVTPEVPARLEPGIAKSFAPAATPAVPGAPVALTIDIWNDSNQSVDSITVQDPKDGSANPFQDDLRIVGISELTPPSGADRVTVQWLDATAGSTWVPASPSAQPIPSDPDDLLIGAPASTDILGVRLVFSKDGGTIPMNPSGGEGKVVFDTVLRAGITVVAPGRDVVNTATAKVTKDLADSGPVDAPATLELEVAEIGPLLTKSFDAHRLVPGESTTARLEAGNGDFPIVRMEVAEPAAGEKDLLDQGLEFGGFVDADVEWPAGATDATFRYTYSDGPGTPVSLTPPASFPAAEPGRTVVGFAVSYTGPMPPRAYAAIPFRVVALPVPGLADIPETNVAWSELESAEGLEAEVFDSDTITRTPARVNTTVAKQIVPSTIWAVPGSTAVILTEAKVNQRTDVPDSTVGAQVLKVSDPASPSGTIDGFWDRFDVRAIAPTAVPANATVTANYWNVSSMTWEPLGATAVGPVSGWTYSIPSAIRNSPDFGGIQLVFEPTVPGTLLPPGFTVAPYFQVALRSTLRSDGQPIVSPATVPNVAQSYVENTNADPVFATSDDPAQITINPTVGPGPGPGPGTLTLADKAWIDPPTKTIEARTGDEATARLHWTTDGLPLDRVVVSDPAPASAIATGLPSVETTVFDAFDLLSIAPITNASDPTMTFDAVSGVFYYSAADDAWRDITSTVCSPASVCDGQFPGVALTPAQTADAIGVRIEFVESPTRASRITSPLDPPVGTGVAASAGFRPIDLTFEVRDYKRSDGSAVIHETTYNTVDAGVVNNTVRVDGWDGPTSYSTVDDDLITILDVPLNISVTKAWDQTLLGLPPIGSDPDRYPLSTATIVGTNETPARVNTLMLADPNPSMDPADSAFEYLDLYQILGVSVPDGATSSQVLITYDPAPGSCLPGLPTADPATCAYSIAQAQALTTGVLEQVIAITVRHDGRIVTDATTELQYVAQLRATERTSGAPISVPAGGSVIADNTVRATVQDPGGTPGQAGEVTDDDNAIISVVEPTYDVTAFKTITPDARNQEDSDSDVTVELSGQPSGTVRTLTMTYTDADPRFWNAYDFSGFRPTTLAVPITRVAVEALVDVDYALDVGGNIVVTCPANVGDPSDLTSCWQPVDTKTGASGSTVTLSLGAIDPEDIRGLRYTIDRVDGANWERPYNPRQRVRFTADRRDNLLIGPNGTDVDPVPSTQPYPTPRDPAPEETVLGRTSNEFDVEGVGGWLQQLAPDIEWRESDDANAHTDLRHQQNAVRIVKSPKGDVSPGTTIPFQIAVTNTGAWTMTGVKIVDEIEADGFGARLVVPTVVPGDPPVFVTQLRNASGVLQPAPAFAHAVTLPTITFTPVDPTFVLEPGWSLTITANLEVRSDIPANQNIFNGAQVTTDRLFDSCVGAIDTVNQPAVGPVAECETTTQIHTVAASPLQIIKGVRGAGGGVRGALPGSTNYDDLGVLASTGAPDTAYCEVPNWDPDGAPGTGDEYYRSPCVPITRPGGGEEWRVDVKNSGNIPSTRIAMIDVLPSYGDRGVIIDQMRSSKWAPDFVGGLDVIGTGTADWAKAVVTLEYLPTIPSTVCNRLDIYSQMTGQPVTNADLQAGEPASCIAEVNGGRGWLAYDEPNMTPEELTEVKALRIVVTYPTAVSGEGLQPDETLTIVYASQTAPYAERAETQDRDSIAWNSIAGGALGVDPSTDISYASLIREPRKTGVAMALGKLELGKSVSTPAAWPFGSVMPDEYDFTLQCTSAGEDVPIRGLAGEDLSSVTLAADGTVLTLNNGKAASDPENTDWSYVNLPLYADCTLVEAPSPAVEVSLSPTSATALRDFDTRTDVANPAWPTPLALQGVTATNTYSYTTFSVTKSVDIGPAVDENGTAIERPGPYQFTAVCDFLGATALDETFTLAHGDSWSPPAGSLLPAGSSCTVTETTANGAGSATTDVTLTNGIVDPAVPHLGTKTVSFVLEPDSTGVIDISLAFANTFGAGELRIDKAVAGAGAGAWGNADFTVDVVCTIASASPSAVYTGSFTLSKTTPSSPVITNLATGAECVVTESATGGANVSAAVPTTITITDATATPQVVTVTNTFQTGSVRVTKALSGAPAAGLTPATGHVYEFSLACTRVVNGATETIAIPGGATRTVTGAGSADWTGLPTGASCTVTETDSGLASSTTLSPAGGTVTVGNGNVQTVTVTNTFANGSLPVSKAVTGAGSAFAPTSFTATVTCTWHGANVPLPAGGVITVTDGNTTTVTGVPVDSICSVAENDHGQKLPNPSTPASVTVTDGGTATTTLALTNEYELASLTVTKDVVTSSTPIPTEFEFSIACTFNGATVLSTTFKLDDAGVRTFTGLPARASCTIVETDDRDADDTTVAGSSAGGVVPTQATRTVVFTSLTPDASAAPVTQNSATFTNTFGIAGLTVTKHIEGGAAWRAATETFPVDVYCTYGIDVLVDETVNLSAAAPTASWTSVVPGAVCDIAETDAGDADVTTIAVDGGAATPTMTSTVTVVDGSVTDVEIANWYLTGSVEVTKFFEGPAAGKFGDRDYGVELTCTLDGAAFPVPGGGTRVLDATAPLTTYTGLPTGTVCDLAELTTGGATSTRIIDATTGAAGPTLVAPATAGWSFTIDTTGAPLTTSDDAQTPLGVVNRYEYAEVSAAKTVDDGGALDASGNPVEYGPFEATLTCTLDGVAIDALEPATQSFMSGDTVTWTELAVGADCTIEESDPADAAAVELTVTQAGTPGTPVAATSVLLAGLSDTISGGNAVELRNGYEAVSIEIEKRILGSDQGRAAGPYPVTVVCTLVDASHPAPGLLVRDIQGDIGGPAALTIVEDDLPAQASCVVTETDAGTANATSISFAGGPAVPSTRGTFLLPLGLSTGATITVTNLFDLALTGSSVAPLTVALIGFALLLWGGAAVVGIEFWRRRRIAATS